MSGLAIVIGASAERTLPPSESAASTRRQPPNRPACQFPCLSRQPLCPPAQFACPSPQPSGERDSVELEFCASPQFLCACRQANGLRRTQATEGDASRFQNKRRLRPLTGMKTPGYVILLVAALAFAACSPPEAAALCSPANCSGCCKGSTCEAGTSLVSCGRGGVSCDVCVGAQVCGSRCEAPPVRPMPSSARD